MTVRSRKVKTEQKCNYGKDVNDMGRQDAAKEADIIQNRIGIYVSERIK